MGKETKKIKVSEDDFRGFIEAHKIKSDLSFEGYLKSTYGLGDNDALSLSLQFPGKNIISGVDLSGWDFRNYEFGELEFRFCNLSRSNFHGVDLSHVEFHACNMQGADLRKAKLTDTVFIAYKPQSLKELCFSVARSEIKKHDVANKKAISEYKEGIIKFGQEQREKVVELSKQINKVYEQLSLINKAKVYLGRETGVEEYDELVKKIKEESEKCYKGSMDFTVSPSTIDVMKIDGVKFDPLDDDTAVYIPMTRKDVEQLSRRKIKEIAEEKAKTENIMVDHNQHIVPDFSYGDKDGNPIDLRELEFDNTGCCLTGALVEGNYEAF